MVFSSESTFGEAKFTKKFPNCLEVRKIIRTFASFFKTLLPFEKHFNLCIQKKN